MLEFFHHAVDMVGMVHAAPAPAFHLIEICAGEFVPAPVVPVDVPFGIGDPGELGNGVRQRGELRRLLLQSFAQDDLIAQVVGDFRCADDGAVRIANRRHGDGDRDHLAGFGAAQGFELRNQFSRPDPREDRVLFVLSIVGDDAADGLADHFVGGPAEQPFRGGIPRLDNAIERLGNYRIGRTRHDGGETCGVKLWYRTGRHAAPLSFDKLR